MFLQASYSSSAVGIAEGLRTETLWPSGPDAPSPIVLLAVIVALVVTCVLLLLRRSGFINPPSVAAFAGALLVLTAVTWARDSMPTALTPHPFSWQSAASQAANSLVTATAFGVAVAVAAGRLLAQDRERARQPA